MALRRQQVAKILGVSITTLKKWHGTHLNPTRSSEGAYEYDRTEVHRLLALRAKEGKRRSRPSSKGEYKDREGRKAAIAFSMFEDGASLRDVVIALAVVPSAVKHWWRDWRDGYQRKFDLESSATPKAELTADAAQRDALVTPTLAGLDEKKLEPKPEHDEAIASLLKGQS